MNRATGHVFNCKTRNHSSMGVATGNTRVSTTFDVPADIELWPSELCVVANGIPTMRLNITVQ